MALALTLSACKGAVSEGEAAADDTATPAAAGETEGEAESEAASPSPMSAGALGGFAEMLKKGLDEPGPYDEPKSSPDFDAEADHWLSYELDGAVVELQDASMFGGGSGTPLRQLGDRLEGAAENEAVKGLLLRIGDLQMSMADAQELRGHLLAFKGEGARRLACHAEGLGNLSMYVASVCDEIALAPLGGVVIPGPASGPVHLKGLLDKLELEADFIHVGAFKSGPEPLTHEAPSPETLEVMRALVDGSYSRLVDGIATGRELEAKAVEAAIDEAIFGGETAKTRGLVDAIEVYEDFRARNVGELGWTRLKLSEKDKFDDPMALQRFLGILPPKRPDEPHVALVYAVGNVIDGKGAGIPGASSEIASRPLAAAMRALAADDEVKAVVLRVDSPGGSALASEIIHVASLELAEKKPLIVSMGSVAASGGYYISAGATKIFAQPDTLTGSIGVFGGKIAMRDALENLGIQSYEVTKGKRALIYSALDPWNEGEREAVRAEMQATYDRFLDRVAAGREMTREAVHEVAQGRVWTGAQARERGLVDELGGLDDALAAAQALAEVGPEVGLEVYPPDPTLRDLLAGLAGGGSPFGVHALAGLEGRAWAANFIDPATLERVASHLRLLTAMRGTQIWAYSFVSPVH